MISGPCGRRSIGNTRANRSGSSTQPPAICGVSDDVAHVSMTSGSPTKPPGWPRCVGGVAGRHVGRRVDRQRVLAGNDRVVVVGLAVVADRVPQRDRHAEEALAADQPVAVEPLDPVVVAVAHVVGVPGQLLAAGEELLAAVLVAAAVADVPLAAGDDLQRAAAALVELDRVGDRLAARRCSSPDSRSALDRRRLRLLDGPPGERRRRRSRAGVGRRSSPASPRRSGRRGRSRCASAGRARATT